MRLTILSAWIYYAISLGLVPSVTGASCPTSAVFANAPLGSTAAWSDILPDPTTGVNSPVSSSAASSGISQCCPSGSNITRWEVAGTLVYSYVGQLTALCSDGSKLQSPIYGYNGTAGNCSSSLNPSGSANSPQNATFTARAGFAFRQFLSLPASSDTEGLQSFQCPAQTQPIGFVASSSCYSVSGFQLQCGSLESSSNSQGRNSSALSGGAIAGIVIGALAGLGILVLAVLGFVLYRRRSNRRDDDLEQPMVALGNSGAKSSLYSSSLELDSTMLHLEEPEMEDGVPMCELRVPTNNSASFADLPSSWRIPLNTVRVYTRGGKPVILGKGGFGVVYHGVVRKDEAALKFVKGGGDEQQARFLHEIKILEQCKSGHIVQFYGFCVTKDGLLLAMEYMQGGTLYDSLHSSDAFQWYKGGLQAMENIAAGLFFLHDINVAHLDIKSPNCLMTREGKVKIGDVGLGKLVSGIETKNSAVGSLYWLSVEQILHGTCGLHSDIYALGVVLWEVCTLETPSRALRNLNVPEEAPQDVQDLITACINPEPSERPKIGEICELLAAMRSRELLPSKGSI